MIFFHLSQRLLKPVAPKTLKPPAIKGDPPFSSSMNSYKDTDPLSVQYLSAGEIPKCKWSDTVIGENIVAALILLCPLIG